MILYDASLERQVLREFKRGAEIGAVQARERYCSNLSLFFAPLRAGASTDEALTSAKQPIAVLAGDEVFSAKLSSLSRSTRTLLISTSPTQPGGPSIISVAQDERELLPRLLLGAALSMSSNVAVVAHATDRWDEIREAVQQERDRSFPHVPMYSIHGDSTSRRNTMHALATTAPEAVVVLADGSLLQILVKEINRAIPPPTFVGGSWWEREHGARRRMSRGGVYLTPFSVDDPAARGFVDAYWLEYGYYPSIDAARAHDAVLVAAAALSVSRVSDATSARNSLMRLQIPLAAGRWKNGRNDTLCEMHVTSAHGSTFVRRVSDTGQR